jgi:hypothetical protein
MVTAISGRSPLVNQWLGKHRSRGSAGQFSLGKVSVLFVQRSYAVKSSRSGRFDRGSARAILRPATTETRHSWPMAPVAGVAI